jgi:hypothetical protein
MLLLIAPAASCSKPLFHNDTIGKEKESESLLFVALALVVAHPSPPVTARTMRRAELPPHKQRPTTHKAQGRSTSPNLEGKDTFMEGRAPQLQAARIIFM